MRTTRRWRWWAGLALVAGLFLVGGHYVWFGLFGPPARWGTGVVGLDPRLGPASAGAGEPGEWAPDAAATLQARLAAIGLTGIEGKPFQLDVDATGGAGVLQTSAGPSWTQGQRLYVRTDAAAPWREFALPPGLTLSDATLIRRGGRPVVVASAWQPWWPYERSYGRFIGSLVDPPRRAEYAVYLLDVDGGAPRYLFPGEALELSPDRRAMAYVTSENDHAGYHTIAVWRVDADAPEPVLSLWEMDPGSGRSFGYGWSLDSRALRIDGATQGFARFGAGRYRTLRLVYLVESRRLIDLGG